MWHAAEQLPEDVGAVVLPGGFAHGDYLRTGAIARFSPVMAAVSAFAADGGPVLGICNGFQILCEAGLLPGALQKNAGLKFLCATVEVVVETSTTSVTSVTQPGDVLRLPINHFEGNFTCSPETMADLIEHDQIVFRYRQNPNGSMGDVAGVCNRARNVVGLMPHPERAVTRAVGLDRRPRHLRRPPRRGGRRADRRAGYIARVSPAFLSTEASTPISRHAA